MWRVVKQIAHESLLVVCYVHEGWIRSLKKGMAMELVIDNYCCHLLVNCCCHLLVRRTSVADESSKS